MTVGMAGGSGQRGPVHLVATGGAGYSNSIWYGSGATTNTAWTTSTNSTWPTTMAMYTQEISENLIKVRPGHGYEIQLPDGIVIIVDKAGNCKINDKNAKITYQSNNNREFNRYINASDILEDFVNYVKKFNVSKREFMNLPVELFINYLILMAAEADGEDTPEGITVDEHPKLLQVLLPKPVVTLPKPSLLVPRCLNSGRFIPSRQKVPFSSKLDMLAYADKISWA